MKIYDSFEQRSPEWYEARMGVATASQFKRIMGGRGGDITYMSELISQRLTNRAKEHYIGDSMEHGIETESQAVANYEFIENVDVRQVAFIKMDDYIGCSPDGLVGDDGLIEIKCPDTHTHIKWTLSGVVPKDHIHQVLGSLWVTGRKWADFISFDPRLDTPHDFFKVRVYSDDHKEDIESISKKVLSFKENMIESLKKFKKV